MAQLHFIKAMRFTVIESLINTETVLQDHTVYYSKDESAHSLSQLFLFIYLFYFHFSHDHRIISTDKDNVCVLDPVLHLKFFTTLFHKRLIFITSLF